MNTALDVLNATATSGSGREVPKMLITPILVVYTSQGYVFFGDLRALNDVKMVAGAESHSFVYLKSIDHLYCAFHWSYCVGAAVGG